MQSPTDTCRILVADDEPPILELFQQILAPERDSERRVGDLATEPFKRADTRGPPFYELTLCRQGDEAVDAVAKAVEEGRPYSVAFLDVRMAPGISGVEAGARIRDLDPGVLVVMITAFSDLDPLAMGEQIPPMDKLFYLQKPFHPNEIVQFAASLCANRRTRREFQRLQDDLETQVGERAEELSRTVSELTASEARYRAIFEHTGAATVIIGEDTVISMANQRFEELSGHSRGEIEGVKSWTEYVHPKDLAEMRSHHKKRRSDPGSAPSAYEFRFLTANDELRHIHLVIGMLPDGKRSVASLLDITDLKRAERQLIRQALYDELTRLPNRTLFADRLAQRIALSQKKDNPFGILLLDLDRFKVINESLGHTVGDTFLTHVANRLRRLTHDDDVLARFDGDTFAMFLDNPDDVLDPSHTAERILAELAAPVRIGNRDILTTASLGVVLSKGDYDEPDQMLRDADIAMYRAKNEGGDRYMLFSKAMHEQAARQLALESDLRRAVKENRLTAHYQPIVRIEDMRVAGFEALVRWTHDRRGPITPLEFIPVAEDTGLITDIDLQVLDQSCRMLRQWRDEHEHARDLSVSVNLSGRDLERADLIPAIRSALDGHGLAPRDLHLEITESILMQAGDSAATTLNALRALSMKLAVDDFGTGYSSLALLKFQPIDVLKIDRSFVVDMESSHESMEIVRTIMGLAHFLGLEVTAEGVETGDHLRILRKLGCDYAQGYLFSRPLPPDEATRLVEKGLDMSRVAKD